MTVQMLKVQEGYRIQVENGLQFPQRFSASVNDWVYYTDWQYGCSFNVSFKTERGAVNFLDLQWWMDISSAEQDEHLKTGNVSDQILKKLGLRRKVK